MNDQFYVFVFTSCVILSISIAVSTMFSVVVLNQLKDLKLKGFNGLDRKQRHYKNVGGIMLLLSSCFAIWFLHVIRVLNGFDYLLFLSFATSYVILGFCDYLLKPYKYVDLVLLALLTFTVVYCYNSYFINHDWPLQFFNSSSYIILVLSSAAIVGFMYLLHFLYKSNKGIVLILFITLVVLSCYFEMQNSISNFYFNMSILATLLIVIYFELKQKGELHFGKSGVYLISFYLISYVIQLLN